VVIVVVNIEIDQSGDGNDEEDEWRQNDPYQEEPYNRQHDNNAVPSNSRRSESNSKRGKRKQKITWEDSSSSNIEQSFSDFGINDSSVAKDIILLLILFIRVHIMDMGMARK
jgi:hypothetical protein